jgi:hypothetical protein
MTNYATLPVLHQDSGEIIGYVRQDKSGWSGSTVFKYVLGRADTMEDAMRIVTEHAYRSGTATWQYFDTDDNAWHSCIMKEVYEDRVVVLRTNDMGYHSHALYKIITIENPDDTKLILT